MLNILIYVIDEARSQTKSKYLPLNVPYTAGMAAFKRGDFNIWVRMSPLVWHDYFIFSTSHVKQRH